MNANESNNRVSDEVISAEAEFLAAQEALEAARIRLAELKSMAPVDSQVSASESTGVLCDEDETVEVTVVAIEETMSEGEPVVFEAVTACAVGNQVDAQADTKTDNSISEGVSSQPAAPAPEPPTGDPIPEWVPYSTAPKATPASVEPTPIPQSNSTPTNGEYQAYQQPQPQASQQVYGGYVAPGYSQAPHAGPGAVPPQQPYYGYQYQQPYYQQPYPTVVASKDHVAAGLLAIFLGQLGIHKFYLGYNTAGFIMLAVTIIGSIFTFGLAAGVMWIIAIIEGILYLTKSQSEFEQTYVINKREWF